MTKRQTTKVQTTERYNVIYKLLKQVTKSARYIPHTTPTLEFCIAI